MTGGNIDTETCQRKVDRMRGKQSTALDDLEKYKKLLKSHKNRAVAVEKARIIFQEVAQETQRNLEYHVGGLVTLALRAVFPEPIDFVVRFEQRRGHTECDLLFEEEGEEFKPIDGSGGGPLDVAAFALRIAFWTLNKTSPVLVLDEPMKNVSPDLQYKVSEMIKMVSEKLKLQIIMVSHAEDINECADRTFIVTKRKGVATVKVEEGYIPLRRRGE